MGQERGERMRTATGDGMEVGATVSTNKLSLRAMITN
jgi:hypothetical protein